jgi:hypothetical protein
LVAVWQRVRDAAQLAAAEGGFLHHRVVHALLCESKRSRSARQRTDALARRALARQCRAGRSTRTPAQGPCAAGHGRRERKSVLAAPAQHTGRFGASLPQRRTHLDGARQQVHRRGVLRSVAAAAARRKMSIARRGSAAHSPRTSVAASKARNLNVVDVAAMLHPAARLEDARRERCKLAA